MKFQKFEWSCGAAAVSNALNQFGVREPERSAIHAADSVPTNKCKHCLFVDHLISSRTCSSSYWRCKCAECYDIRRAWRKDCIAGTSEQGILRAVRTLGNGHGISASEYQSESRNNAWQWLHGSLIHGRAVILCIDRWSHWVVAFAGAGDRVCIFDSYPSKKNKKCNGVHTLRKSDLMRRWWNGTKWAGKEKRLYAISVSQ